MKIDSHQHFWNYNPVEYDWIDNSMSVLKKNFLPEQLKNELQGVGLEASIAVQARTNLDETKWLLNLAREHEFIAGVVGWIDLKSETLDEALSYFSKESKLVGFREILQDKEPEFMLDEIFLEGIKKIGQHNYTYDILVFPHHLKSVLTMINQLPKQRLVLDHLAKPLISKREIMEWARDIKAISLHSNVTMKLSGMVTEANVDWSDADFKQYLDVIFDCFGEERIFFGSDWPVCLLRADYQKVYEIAYNYVTKYSKTAFDNVFGANAMRFYLGQHK